MPRKHKYVGVFLPCCPLFGHFIHPYSTGITKCPFHKPSYTLKKHFTNHLIRSSTKERFSGAKCKPLNCLARLFIVQRKIINFLELIFWVRVISLLCLLGIIFHFVGYFGMEISDLC